MKRLAIGAALGGLAVYLYDPELGENRRGRLASLWQENRTGVLHATRTASQTIDSARPTARRITEAIGRAKWPPLIERGRPAASLPGLIGAAAVGGALVYFLDPVRGWERRMQALGTVRRIANMVKPARDNLGDQVTNAIESTKSMVR